MKKFLIAFAVLLGAALCGVAAARALLPVSACAVSEEHINALILETSYETVKARLGCDGERHVVYDEGGFRIETYRWRGTAWPYGTFTGHFYNGVMHGTEKLWLNAYATWPENRLEKLAASR